MAEKNKKESTKKESTKKESTKKGATKKGSTKKVEVASIEKRKTRRELIKDLGKLKDDIEIEILNISYMQCCYGTPRDGIIFDIMSGESTRILLSDAVEMANKSPKFFKDYLLIITDVYDDNYTLEDILLYLGLDTLYKDIENHNEDFIEQLIVDSTDDEFKDKLSTMDKKFIQNIACRMIIMSSDYEISRSKDRMICELLNLDRDYLV